MLEAFPNPSQRVNLFFKLNRAQQIKINLTQNGVPVSNTNGWTWQLVIKTNPGERLNIVSLTLNNGLRYEVYTDYILIADIPAQSIEEGEYYYELIRTDLNRTWVEGSAWFTFSNP